MSIYNDTLLANNTNIADMYIAVDTAANGLITMLMLVVIWIIIFVAQKQAYDTVVGFLLASFVTSVVAIMMFVVGTISFYVFLVPLILTMLSVAALVMGK